MGSVLTIFAVAVVVAGSPPPTTDPTRLPPMTAAGVSGAITSQSPAVKVIGDSSSFCLRRLTAHRNATDPVLVALGDGTYAAAWRDGTAGSYTAAYAQLDADGALLAGPRAVTRRAEGVANLGLAWSGSALGLVWFERLGNHTGIFFRLLERSGRPRTGRLRIDGTVDSVEDSSGDLPAVNFPGRTALDWDGAGWGVAWWEFPSGRDADLAAFPLVVRFARVAADGQSRSAPVTVSDNNGPAEAVDVRLIWNGTDYGLVWLDTATNQFRYRRVMTDGTPLGPSVMVTASPAVFLNPALAWNGAEYGLAWLDFREDDIAIYFRRFDRDGGILSSEIRLSDPLATTGFVVAADVVLAWLGDRWAAAATDFRDGDATDEVRLSFADASGAKLGSDVLVSTPADGASSTVPALAAQAGELLLAWQDAADGESLEIRTQAVDELGAGAGPVQAISAAHRPGHGVLNAQFDLLHQNDRHLVAYVDEQDLGSGTPWLGLVDGHGRLVGKAAIPDTLPAGAVAVALASSGEVLGALWLTRSGEVRLSRFQPAGLKLGSDLLLSSSARTQQISLTWDGASFLAAWVDNRDGNLEVYTASVNAAGALLAGPHRISEDAAASRQPVIAAGPGGPRLVVWQDARGTAPELWSALLDASGARSGAETALTADDGQMSDQPDLAFQGSEFGLVWREAPLVEFTEVHFRRLSAAGLPLGLPVKVSDIGGIPRLIWSGDRWGVAHNGSGGAFFAELDATGAVVSPSRAVFRLPNGLRRPAVDWDGERFVLAVVGGYRAPDAELYMTSAACAADDTPPTCPTGLTGVTVGSELRLAWRRGSDGDGALRWQYLRRDGERFAALPPDAASFADDLPPPGNHTYSVISVNQGLREAAACPEVTVSFSAVIFADGFESGNTSAWSSASP